MDYIPIFTKLKQRPVLVVGGGEVAARKVNMLLCAGAKVKIVAKKLSMELDQLYQEGHIHFIGKNFSPEQLHSVYLVIAATNNRSLNYMVFKESNRRYMFSNIVDHNQYCSFIFPSIVDRSPLLVAMASSAQSPVLVRILREKIETFLPKRIGKLVEFSFFLRNKIKKKINFFYNKRIFFEQFFTGYFSTFLANGPYAKSYKKFKQNILFFDIIKKRKIGEISLIGAGPGDVGLLTLKGLQVMQKADVVMYDHLMKNDILDLVRRDADRICVGKCAGVYSVMQKETNPLLVELAQQGKRVVRLKGGDPFIFGRGGEEMQAISSAGIPFQVVPGITAALGGTAYAGIPLTHRYYAQSVIFITGYYKPGINNRIDFEKFSISSKTLVIYMGSMKSYEISENLIENGRAANTPIAVISSGTCLEQQVKIGTLQQLEMITKYASLPTLLVIGEVVEIHNQLTWFGEKKYKMYCCFISRKFS